MSTINGLSYADMRNVNLKGASSYGTGTIRFDPANGTFTTNPFVSTDYGLYVNSSGSLVFSSLGTATVLGGSTPGGVPTWEQIFASDTTFNVAGNTWTIDNSTGSNDVLTLTNSGAGSGSTLQITNGGSGSDVKGTSGTWSVSKTGVAVFLSAQVTTNVIGSSGLTLSATGAGLITIGANTNTVTVAKATTFSSTITVTDGLTDLISTSNTAAALRITNNTATTWGAAAASAGVAIVRSTSLTTGSLLRLQLTEATLTTGNYIDCWDVTGSAIVFEVGKAGAVTIAGAGGSTVFTITAGDAILSDASLAITDADNAASFTVTNNTATSASVAVFAGSGVFTGTTTTSWMTITPSGLTTGTALYIAAAGATTSVAVVDIAVAGLTSGSALRITSATANFTTGAKLIELTSTAAVAGNLLTATTTGAYTGTGMVLITAGAMTTGITLSIVSTTGLTTGSLIRATSSTAGAIQTNGAISFTATGAFTSNSAVDGGFVEVKANSTLAGTIVNVVGSALTTGIGLQLSNGTSAMTTGSLIRVTASGTGTIATNGIVSITHAGVYVSTATAGLLDVRATALVGTGTVVNFVSSAASQTTANIMTVTQSGATITGYTGNIATFVGAFTGAGSTGSIVNITAVNDVAGNAFKITNNALTLGAGTLINLVHGTSVIGAGSSMLRITSTGADTGTTTGCLVDLASSTATAGTLFLITSASLATGSAMVFNLNGLTTGVGFSIAHTTSVLASGGSLLRLSSTSVDTGTTTGNLLDLSSTNSLAGTMVLGTFSGLTTGIGISIATAALTTGQALKVSDGAGTGITTGSLISVSSATTGVVATNGIVSITASGVYTSTSNVGLLNVVASATTAGTVAQIQSNSLTTGIALTINGSGAYTGTGFLTVTQSGLTTGVGVIVTTSAITTGQAVSIVSASTSTGAYRLLKLNNSNATASSTAIPLEVLNSGTAASNANFSAIAKFGAYTIWVSNNNTAANGALSGTAGDICLNGGSASGKMAYCTGTTSWTTLT